jgi:hypothetical protein
VKNPKKFFLLIFLAVIVLNSFLYWFATIPERLAKKVQQAFHDTFQVSPEIQVNQTIVFGQISPIAEFAVVTQEQLMEYDYRSQMTLGSHPIPFTEKKIWLRAPYRIKAGFDLHKPFRVKIDSKTGRIQADLPAAEILSVERHGDLRVEGNDGWLNKVTDSERQSALNALDQQARAEAEKSNLKEQAQDQASARLKELFDRNEQPIEFRFRLPGVEP